MSPATASGRSEKIVDPINLFERECFVVTSEISHELLDVAQSSIIDADLVTHAVLAFLAAL
jgi:hypothetical protein